MGVMFEDLRVTPAMPAGHSAVIPEDDEPSQALDARDHSSGFTTFIKYENGKGERSQRLIVCKSIVVAKSGLSLGAVCLETSAYKHFRADRILEMVDAVSGELFDAGELIASLHMRGALRTIDHVLNDVARVLVFMARCDGDYHPLEEAALFDAFESYVHRFGGNERLVEEAYTNSSALAPDGADISRALRNFAENPNGRSLARFILDRSNLVMDADGYQHPEEFAWAVDLNGRLAKLAGR